MPTYDKDSMSHAHPRYVQRWSSHTGNGERTNIDARIIGSALGPRNTGHEVPKVTAMFGHESPTERRRILAFRFLDTMQYRAEGDSNKRWIGQARITLYSTACNSLWQNAAALSNGGTYLRFCVKKARRYV